LCWRFRHRRGHRPVYLSGRGWRRWLLSAGAGLYRVLRGACDHHRLNHMCSRRCLFHHNCATRRCGLENLLHLLGIQRNAGITLKSLLLAGKGNGRRRRRSFYDNRLVGNSSGRLRNIRRAAAMAGNGLHLRRNLCRPHHLSGREGRCRDGP
jgi:hypothetical protein